MMALEERFQTTLDEGAFAAARTVGDLQALVAEPATAPGQPPPPAAAEPMVFPAWNRSLPARALRRASLPTWILPWQRLFTRIHVEGADRLAPLAGPVVFASNHQSHMDSPAILLALPRRWRYRVAIAMAKETFKAHFHPAQHGRGARAANSLKYYLACLFFNAFPLPQREAGTRQTLPYIGELLGDGYSVLIYPEGKRTDEGEINRFQAGVGMIGARLGVPVVPVRLVGLDRVLHHGWRWPVPGDISVKFGSPMNLAGEDYASLARQVEEAVRGL
jgi:long-chain acyl-CoA synthetase